MTAGLGQTVALYLAKGKAEHTRLLKNLAQWLLGDGEKPAKGKTGQNLLDEIMDEDSDRYRQLRINALVYLTWLKRFAEARSIKNESKEDHGT
jgi:CRISPR type III-B/RAMP module-associated protein Cmr5